MFIGNKANRNTERVVAGRGVGTAASVLGAATIFVLALATPVTIDTGSGIPTLNTAQAAKGGGNNGNGGGNGGGGTDGGNGSGGNGGGGNGGGTDGGNGGGREALLLVEEAITVALFTTRISKGHPADKIFTHNDPERTVYFFSELQAMSGRQVTHRWRYRGEMIFEDTFMIRADSWRVWSGQLLPADKPGEWEVEILDQEGGVLEVYMLNFVPSVAVL